MNATLVVWVDPTLFLTFEISNKRQRGRVKNDVLDHRSNWNKVDKQLHLVQCFSSKLPNKYDRVQPNTTNSEQSLKRFGATTLACSLLNTVKICKWLRQQTRMARQEKYKKNSYKVNHHKHSGCCEKPKMWYILLDGIMLLAVSKVMIKKLNESKLVFPKVTFLTRKILSRAEIHQVVPRYFYFLLKFLFQKC